MSEFNAEDWLRLTPAQRVAQCRRMAEEARGLSKESSGDLAQAYTELARNWDNLAEEIERTIPR